jgi:hypothetical protein
MHGCGQPAPLRHQQQMKMARHDHIAKQQKIASPMLTVKVPKHEVTVGGGKGRHERGQIRSDEEYAIPISNAAQARHRRILIAWYPKRIKILGSGHESARPELQ